MDLETLTHDYEVWLYGSRARGDADRRSDTDVLIIGDHPRGTEELVAALPWHEVAVSFYSWAEVGRMWEYGSLFLDHVRREGRRLRPSRARPDTFPRMLAGLPPFARARHDLNAFRLALTEGQASMADHGWPDLELQILATVARHAAILACYCVGQSAFGRLWPFELWGRAAGWRVADVSALANGSVTYRFTPLGAPEWGELEVGADHWMALVQRLLDEMEELVDRYEETLHKAA